MIIHTVKAGECLATIAANFGFQSWKTIYEAPENADFRNKRPNPNILYAGDKIVIPDKGQKKEDGNTEKKHRFNVPSAQWVFRIEMKDDEYNALDQMPFELRMDNHEIIRGQSKENGLIEIPIPPDVRSGILFFGGEVLDLRFGDLDPISRITGVQARLNNMGYPAGPVDGIVGPRTRRAVSLFQKHERLSVTNGEITYETRHRLLEVHDGDNRVLTEEEDMASQERMPAYTQETVAEGREPTEGWCDRMAHGQDECFDDNPCSNHTKCKRNLYFAIYYSVPDRAFEMAAETWRFDVEQRMLFDQTSLFIMKEVKTETGFKEAWMDIACQAQAKNAVVLEGAIFSHASKGDKSDGLEFKSNREDDGTLTKSDIEALPVLNWPRKLPFDTGILVIYGCNSGLSGNRGWAPASVFAKSQGVTTVGQAGYSTFSTSPDHEYPIYGQMQTPAYLWAFASGRNNLWRPILVGGPRMPAIVYYAGETPYGVGVDVDYHPKDGLQFLIKVTHDH